MHNEVKAILEDKGNEVVTVESSCTALEAVARMNEAGIGAVVVVDGERTVGIFTERDVLVRVVSRQRDPAATRVSEVMTAEVISIELNTTVGDAMRIVTKRRCRHLPVFDGGRLVGLISSGDLTRWVVRDQEGRISDLETYVMRG
jgi:CBS domain-containing protein